MNHYEEKIASDPTLTYARETTRNPRIQGGQPMTRRLTTMVTLGGCEDCDSYRELDGITPGVFHATTIHNPTCPTLSGRTAASTPQETP